MKNLLVGLAIFVGFSSNSQVKIAYVNSQKLLDAMPSRKIVDSILVEKQKAAYIELKEMDDNFQAEYQKFVAEGENTSPLKKQNDQAKLARLQQNLEIRQSELESEIKAEADSLNKKITDRLKQAVAKVSETKKINIVIDQSTTLFVTKEIEITDEVLKELLLIEEKEPKIK